MPRPILRNIKKKAVVGAVGFGLLLGTASCQPRVHRMCEGGNNPLGRPVGVSSVKKTNQNKTRNNNISITHKKNIKKHVK